MLVSSLIHIDKYADTLYKVGNICDNAYLGLGVTLQTFRPLLQPPSVNPHATLITLFLNAVAEIGMMNQSIPGRRATSHRQALQRLMGYMPDLLTSCASSYPNSPEIAKLLNALELVNNMDTHFERCVPPHDTVACVPLLTLNMIVIWSCTTSRL